MHKRTDKLQLVGAVASKNWIFHKKTIHPAALTMYHLLVCRLRLNVQALDCFTYRSLRCCCEERQFGVF